MVWALWNLILSIAGAILVIMMVIRIRLRKKYEGEEDYDGQLNVTEEMRKQRQRRMLFIIATPVLVAISIIIFLLTQDTSLIMAMADWWTLTHLAFFAAALLCYIFALRRKRDANEDHRRLKGTDDAFYKEV